MYRLESIYCCNSGIYVVVNLHEKFFNSTLEKELYFNTDVVFSPNGVVVARYRKINLYGEGDLSPSLNKELVYFDTDFGVRFGLFTCFDIIFKKPGVELAKENNISHFIFPTRWFSQMPFLTGIQEQNYWAYTLDVVLLASEFNLPSIGNTGSGIYLGKQGAMTYRMTSVAETFLLQANIPKIYPFTENTVGNIAAINSMNTSKRVLNDISVEKEKLNSTEDIYLKLDYLDVYTTELIQLPETTKAELMAMKSENIKVLFALHKNLCQNSLCCDFYLNITMVFEKSRKDVKRGDDYSQLYYRMAVFDGVKNYDGAGTGGVQTCAIVPCVNTELSSCGMRSDSPSAVTNSFSDLYQTDFIFESIFIKGNFSNNEAFVGPNVLLSGDEVNTYGSLLLPDDFIFNITQRNDETNDYVFQTLNKTKIITASIYGRLFSRDGEDYTKSTSSASAVFNFVRFSLISVCFGLKLILGLIDSY